MEDQEKMYTQVQVEETVKARLAKAKKKHELELNDVRADLEAKVEQLTAKNKDLTEKALKADEYKTELDKAQAKVTEFEAKAKKAERLELFKKHQLREDRLDVIDKLIPQEADEKAVEQFAKDYPEFISEEAKKPITTGVAMNFTGGTSSNITTEQFEKMSTLELKNFKENNPAEYEKIAKSALAD